MRIGANARVQWGAVMALLAGLTTVGAIGVAGAQDPVAGVGLAAAGPRVGAIIGRVADSVSGQGIAVATVTVVGTGLSARSGDDGSYRIANVPPGPTTVKVSRIGYMPASKAVTVLPDQDVTVDFALTAQATQLEEVVAIGYGTTDRRELTGAVSSVTAEQVASAPVTSIDQALLGRAGGVQVVTSSGP